MSGCTQTAQETGGTIVARDVTFSTSDGFTIYGSYSPGNQTAVILIPMLGKTRSTWNDFATLLQKRGFSVLSIDSRGHGQSTMQHNASRSYTQFSAQDFQNMMRDVQAAKQFLAQNGKTTFIIVGASIGANVAINYAAEQNPYAVVLLSPGLDYRGVKTQSSVSAYHGPLLIVVSDDDEYAYQSSQTLAKTRQLDLQVYSGAGHGTEMLADKTISAFVLDWIAKQK
ncbi:MAG: alpha/beta fold hydrolase [Candidatus Aenigmarchaeota archaeon]|nr:alpha/beta fold hydrolase [Candidatus Aenigmarchaeota archaeon]